MLRNAVFSFVIVSWEVMERRFAALLAFLFSIRFAMSDVFPTPD
jgi:hypothetical protein